MLPARAFAWIEARLSLVIGALAELSEGIEKPTKIRRITDKGEENKSFLSFRVGTDKDICKGHLFPYIRGLRARLFSSSILEGIACGHVPSLSSL